MILRFQSLLFIVAMLLFVGACKPVGFKGDNSKKSEKSQDSAEAQNEPEDESEDVPTDIPVQVAGMFLCEPVIWIANSETAIFGCRVDDENKEKLIVEEDKIEFKALIGGTTETDKVEFKPQPLYAEWHVIFSITQELAENLTIETTFDDRASGTPKTMRAKLPGFPKTTVVPNQSEESDTIIIFGAEAGQFHIGDGNFCASSCRQDLKYTSLTGQRVWMPFSAESDDTEIDITLEVCGVDYTDAVYVEVYDKADKLAEFVLKQGDSVVSFKGTKLGKAGGYFISIVSAESPGEKRIDDVIISKVKIESTNKNKIIHSGEPFSGKL